MKRTLWLLASLAVLTGTVAVETSHSQTPGKKSEPSVLPGDLGPGEGGATLRLPGMEAPRPTPVPIQIAPEPSVPVVPPSLQGLWKNGAPMATPGPSPKGPGRIALPPSNPNDINKDIEVTPGVGPWMVFLMAYSGARAPEMARKFVMELKSNPKYKLNAYVFNYNAEEKLKEYQRVQALRQQQIDMLESKGLKADMPIRIRTMRIDEQTGVLVGGFKTRDDAEREVKRIKLLPDPDPTKVDMDVTYVGEMERDQKQNVRPDGNVSKVAGTLSYVSPFKRAFPVPNPTVKQEQNSNASAEEIAFMRKLNADEPFSLFQCKKPFTLCIKQCNMQYKMVKDKEEAKAFLDRFFSFSLFKKGEFVDSAAHNARNLAEAFRKSGLIETYVLHARHCSFVTVGGFDRLDDPQLVAAQNFLEARFRADAYQPLQLLTRPVPMIVPR